ncbi:MAG: hypothetical protein M1823_005497 [Watsoniomyces obsoletus]|nr:MAG: hypothetical protein M1823_005497 [Watsoniomyces obsoletus]
MALLAPKEALDSTLVSLFHTEGGGALGKSPIHDKRGSSKRRRSKQEIVSSADDDASTSTSSVGISDSLDDHERSASPPPNGPARGKSKISGEVKSRKRKRNGDNEELEEVYLRRMALAEERELDHRRAEKAKKRSKHDEKSQTDHQETEQETNKRDEINSDASSKEGGEDEQDEDDAGVSAVPQHESLAAAKEDIDVEQASRTVFLGNVSVDAITSKSAKKTLLAYMASFFSTLPSTDAKGAHKVESIRFRSTAFASRSLPKKAAYVRKEVMRATTHSTNAYVVYSTSVAAREAVRRLNGSAVLDRHLRVDSVAHPAAIDHRRCVFVGNLGFVDDESSLKADEDEEQGPKKKKASADVEEGLWRQFGKAGTVESVRVVRDAGTRVGKGIAYVQFKDANAVEAALLFHDKKFPPMLPRKLRVARAKKMRKATSSAQPARNKASRDATKPNQSQVYVAKTSPHLQSLQGRAGKMLGRAGAAKVRRQGKTNSDARRSVPVPTDGVALEGHRARRDEGRAQLKSRKGGSGGRKPRVRTRSTAWKKVNGPQGKKA